MSQQPVDGNATATAARPPRLVYLHDLLRELVVRDVKLRYERSVLGIVWAVLNPLAQLAVFVLVFRYVIQLRIPNYPLFVFIGVVAWNWTREGLTRSANAITANRDLIRQPGFPVDLLPVVSLTTPLIDLLIALPLILILVVLGGGTLTLALLAVPLVIAVQFFLLQGIAYVVAATQVTFRDTSHLLNVILTLVFYLTPVFYDIVNIPARYQALYRFNPMAHILTAYRTVIMDGDLPDLRVLLVLTLVAAVVWRIGHEAFNRASVRFAEEL